MSILLATYASELVKIAEADAKNQSPLRRYAKAVAAGLPVVGVQALSDLPEGFIERSVEKSIRAGKPVAGFSGGITKSVGRLGAAPLTTPLFISGLRDIKEAKTKKDEKRGVAKVLAAGGTYAGLRGGIESAIDPNWAHLTRKQRLGRIAGVNTLLGVGSAALTAGAVGRSLRQKDGEKSKLKKAILPMAVAGTAAGAKGVFDEARAATKAMPFTTRGAVARAGGKAAAGMFSALVLTNLMDRVLNKGKEKRAAEDVAKKYSIPEIYNDTHAWAKSAPIDSVKAFQSELEARGANRSPSLRAASQALADASSPKKQQQLPPATAADVLPAAALMVGPGMLWNGISALEPTDRDRVLSDALDRMYIRGKLEVDRSAKRGGEFVDAVTNVLHLAPDSDPSVIAHELGHATSGKLRKATLQNPSVIRMGQLGLTVAGVLPLVALVAATDQTLATPEELESKAKLVERVGVGAAALATPRLAEEAVASAKGLHYLSRAGATGSEVASKAVTRLLPAFGTYGLAVATPFVAAKAIRRRKGHGQAR